MYFPAIKPIADLSAEVIQLAVSGDLGSARECLDHVRVLRARLARSLKDFNSPVEKLLETQLNPIHAEKKSIDLRQQMTAGEIALYLRYTGELNNSLETIGKWLKSSIEPFCFEELLQSEEGIDLFLDYHLPEVWDFSLDILCLDGEHQQAFLDALHRRGQRKIIHLVSNEELGAIYAHIEAPLKDGSDEAGAFKAIKWDVENPPSDEEVRSLIETDVPNVHLINCSGGALSISPEAAEKLVRRLSAACIGLRSLKEWPVIFVEQWLGQLHLKTRFQSATAISAIFEGRDILVASPGPSLSDCLDTLREHRESFILLSPVRSLPALFNAGIEPDFVVHVDAIDFSKWMPTRAELGNISLICIDHVDSSVWDAGFANVFTLPEAHLNGGEVSMALHDGIVRKIPGGSVSVFAANLAIAFGARSITLIGQDLTTSKGFYAEQVSRDLSVEDEMTLNAYPVHCRGINGEVLTTKADYLWFISEFESIALENKEDVMLINSTAFGAYLEGWEHITFEQNPFVLSGQPQWQDDFDELLRPLDDEEHATRCKTLLSALDTEVANASLTEAISTQLAKECEALIASKSSDVTQVELLEEELHPTMARLGSVVHFYTSRHAVSLVAATKSVLSLEENLSISAEYYSALAPRARNLLELLKSAVKKIELLDRNIGDNSDE